ncbi:hypothetical protein DPMN_102609 [Dreissena polymorpha]|uniref:Uncharacterized protein n=1 Tax=Dreissena polymorpha TaxID=45954 RepID=A0A9D4R990_DREPO|nr:hypothetical protein DPMN_102609 [Dreissena polymorpha]
MTEDGLEDGDSEYQEPVNIIHFKQTESNSGQQTQNPRHQTVKMDETRTQNDLIAKLLKRIEKLEEAQQAKDRKRSTFKRDIMEPTKKGETGFKHAGGFSQAQKEVLLEEVKKSVEGNKKQIKVSEAKADAAYLEVKDGEVTKEAVVADIKEIPLVKKSKRLRKVTVAEVVTVPALSEALVDMTMTRRQNYVIEPAKGFSHTYPLIMAATLVNVNRALTCKHDVEIGEAEKIEKCAGVIAAEENIEEEGNLAKVRLPNKTYVSPHLKPLFEQSTVYKTEEEKQVVASLLRAFNSIKSWDIHFMMAGDREGIERHSKELPAAVTSLVDPSLYVLTTWLSYMSEPLKWGPCRKCRRRAEMMQIIIKDQHGNEEHINENFNRQEEPDKSYQCVNDSTQHHAISSKQEKITLCQSVKVIKTYAESQPGNSNDSAPFVTNHSSNTWASMYPREEIGKMQLEDTYKGKIYMAVQRGDKPSGSEMLADTSSGCMNEVVARWGISLPIHSDKTRTSARHPSGDGQYQTFSKFDRNWKRLFSHAKATPGSIDNTSQYVQELQARMLKAHQVARRQLKSSTSRNKLTYDVK